MKKLSFVLVLMVSMALLCGCNTGPCETCGDTGEVECSGCAGALKVECTECSGDMQEDCHVCDGDGWKYGDCSNCDGSGSSCYVCGGEGSGDVICNNCNGTGESHSKCTSCDEGEMYCLVCNGAGKYPCPVCCESEHEDFDADMDAKEDVYLQAIEKEDDGEYEAARDLYEELGEYKDSSAKVEELNDIIDQQEINSQFELEGEWVSVSGEEIDFFKEYSSDKSIGGFKIVEKDGSYRIYDALEDGYAPGHNKTIVVENDIFTLNADLGDYDVKVFFAEEGNLIFEKYEKDGSEPIQTFEAEKVSDTVE